MKTRLLYFIFIAFLITGNTHAQTWPVTGVTGNGSESNPYCIYTPEHLEALAKYVNHETGNGFATAGKHYKLMNDLDLSEFSNWKPIGNFSSSTAEKHSFQGAFHGNNKTIRNLTINYPTGEYMGLFGSIALGALIENLILEDVNIDCNFGGVIVSRVFDKCIVRDCYTSGKITGKSGAGGVIANAWDSQIYRCSGNVEVFVSGATGKTTDYGKTGGASAGGIIRESFRNSSISQCYSGEDIKRNSPWNDDFVLVDGIGGVAECISSSTMSECYSSGSIVAGKTYAAGGAVGWVYHTGGYGGGNVSNCIAANPLLNAQMAYNNDGNGYVNRFAGYNSPTNGGNTVTGNYALGTMVVKYNREEVPRNEDASLNGTSKSLSDLQSRAFYTTQSNWQGNKAWDFTDVWDIWDGKSYPYFKWQSAPVADLKATRSELIFTLKNNVRKIAIYKNGVLDPTYETGLKVGVNNIEFISNIGDILRVIVHETGKAPSYPVKVTTQKDSRVLYVKQGGVGNGLSWADASGDLQAMIDASLAGDEVWVAAGTYTPATNAGFTMKEGVQVYGGFPNTGNPTMANRTLPTQSTLNHTILRPYVIGVNSIRLLIQPADFNNHTVWNGFVLQATNWSSTVFPIIIRKEGELSNCLFNQN